MNEKTKIAVEELWSCIRQLSCVEKYQYEYSGKKKKDYGFYRTQRMRQINPSEITEQDE